MSRFLWKCLLFFPLCICFLCLGDPDTQTLMSLVNFIKFIAPASLPSGTLHQTSSSSARQHFTAPSHTWGGSTIYLCHSLPLSPFLWGCVGLRLFTIHQLVCINVTLRSSSVGGQRSHRLMAERLGLLHAA